VELNVDILVVTSPPPLRMLLAKSTIGSRESEGAGLKRVTELAQGDLLQDFQTRALDNAVER
jgi:hypothetical protein